MQNQLHFVINQSFFL